jgi:hypothetical protein
VNARRLQDFKNVLEHGDICIYKLDGYIKGATDKKGLPVMVCGMRRYTSPVTQEVSFSYQVCSQHGYLKQRVDRGSLDHYSQLTAELMSINEKAEGFLSGLTIDKASPKVNILGGASFCKCTTDCAKSKTCSCKKFGVLCTTKCHGGRGKNNKCTLCDMD